MCTKKTTFADFETRPRSWSALGTVLDQKLDHVLEKHEKDFLKAYRVQMLKVQDELSQLRARANEKELQSKQEKKISALEQEIAKYRNDCEAIMKYCSM